MDEHEPDRTCQILVQISLLLGIRQLALRGGSTRQMRPAWRLLVFAGFVTLALNVAEPLIERNYGRAAFDAGNWSGSSLILS